MFLFLFFHFSRSHVFSRKLSSWTTWQNSFRIISTRRSKPPCSATTASLPTLIRFQRWKTIFFFENKLKKATRNAKLKLQCIPVLLNGLNFANIWLLKFNTPCFCFLKENNLLLSLECSQSPADSECAVANNDSSLHGERSWNRTRRNVRNRKWSRKKEQDQRHDSYEKSKISCHVLWDKNYFSKNTFRLTLIIF